MYAERNETKEEERKKKKKRRIRVLRNVRKRVMGKKHKDPDDNVGHLIDSKYGGTNRHLDNFIVQNTIMNSADGTKSAIDNRFEKQLSSEHSDPAYDVMFICLDSKIEGETIRPGSILRLEHFDPPLLLNDGKEAEWMVARIYNPEPEEMERLPFHPRRKHSELYEYDFGAKNGREAEHLTELAKLLDHDKRPEGNNSIKQLEGNEYHKELENLIMVLIEELHKPVADEKLAVAGGKLVFLEFQQSQSKNPELPDGMKESEGKAVLKALFQAEEPPAVLHIYTSNSTCFAGDREDKIKEIFAENAPEYVLKKSENMQIGLEKWKSIASMGQKAQRGDDTGYGTTEYTTNTDDEAKDVKAPDVDDGVEAETLLHDFLFYDECGPIIEERDRVEDRGTLYSQPFEPTAPHVPDWAL